MARTYLCGFETQSGDAETFGGGGLGSNCTFDSSIVRSGSWSLKVAAASGVSGILSAATGSGNFKRIYVRVTARPASTARVILGAVSVGLANIRLNPDGTLAYYNNTTLVGTSSTALTDTTKWYRVEWQVGAGTGVTLLQIDGNVEITGNASGNSGNVGAGDTVADTYTAYFDDYASDDAAFPGESHVVLLLPASDNSVGTGWTLGTGTAISGNGFDSVNNTPPLGVANGAAGSDPKQIRNDSSAASSYVANMQTYAAVGLRPTDQIRAVQACIFTGAPVSTGAKTGTLAMSNPTIAATALQGNSGQFWTGSAAGTYPTGWKVSKYITSAPSVTYATTPTMTIAITGGTASRVAMVCSMFAYVEFDAGAKPRMLEVQQALNRSASW